MCIVTCSSCWRQNEHVAATARPRCCDVVVNVIGAEASEEHESTTVLRHKEGMSSSKQGRRRARASVPRQRRIVVRFSDEEFDEICARARAMDMAVSAWLALQGLTAGVGRPSNPAALRDLLGLAAELRVLHRSDVECDRERLGHLLDRVDEAIDLVVQRMGTRSS